MPPNPDTSIYTARKSERTSKTANIAKDEKMSEQDEQSDKINTESDTDSEDARLIVRQTLIITAMKLCLTKPYRERKMV